MSTYLSEVPFQDIFIGQRVVSHIGNPGTVTDLIPIEQAVRKMDNEVTVTWDHGGKSHLWHFWCDHIKLE
jgi:hypothetical protein